MTRRRTTSRPGRPAAMRILNRTIVMDTIREHGALSRADLARLTSISAPTVSAIVSDLIDEGLIREQGRTQASLGRPGRLLAFNESASYVGCDLSSRGIIQLGLVDLHDHVVEVRSLEYEPISPEPHDIVEAVGRYVDRVSAGGLRVRGVGVGSPGVIDADLGRVRWSPALGWNDVALAELLRARLAMPVVVDNDVNLALLGEVSQGAASQARHAVFVVFTDGVGGALLINGEVYRGRGAAGEIGYMVTKVAPAHPGLGSFDLLERRVFDLLADACRQAGFDTSGLQHGISVLVNFLLTEAGDLQLSAGTREALFDAIGGALASVSALLDPEVIVLSGWVRHLGDALLTQLTSRLALTPNRPSLRFSDLGSVAVVVGGAVSARRATTEALHMVAAN